MQTSLIPSEFVAPRAQRAREVPASTSAPAEPVQPQLPTVAQAAAGKTQSEGLVPHLQRLTSRIGELEGIESPPEPAPTVHERPVQVFD